MFERSKPDDWDDDEKYPDKKLEGEYDEGEYRFLRELWSYHVDWNPSTHRNCYIFVRCPKCGGYKISKEEYNNLHPECLAGSSGYCITCDNCGFSERVALVVS